MEPILVPELQQQQLNSGISRPKFSDNILTPFNWDPISCFATPCTSSKPNYTFEYIAAVEVTKLKGVHHENHRESTMEELLLSLDGYGFDEAKYFYDENIIEDKPESLPGPGSWPSGKSLFDGREWEIVELGKYQWTEHGTRRIAVAAFYWYYNLKKLERPPKLWVHKSKRFTLDTEFIKAVSDLHRRFQLAGKLFVFCGALGGLDNAVDRNYLLRNSLGYTELSRNDLIWLANWKPGFFVRENIESAIRELTKKNGENPPLTCDSPNVNAQPVELQPYPQ